MIALLKKTVQSITEIKSVLIARDSEANKLLDHQEFPAVSILPNGGNAVGGNQTLQGLSQWGRANGTYNYILHILLKSEMGMNNDEEHVGFIEQADEFKKEILYRISKEPAFLQFTNATHREVINFLDSNSTGIVLDLGVVLKNGYDYRCYLPD